MWKRYGNVSVKWVCRIKNRGVVTGIDTWTLLDSRNSDVVSKYRVLWYRIAHH